MRIYSGFISVSQALQNLGFNTPILSELESNTDAMQAIRHVVDSLRWNQAMHC